MKKSFFFNDRAPSLPLIPLFCTCAHLNFAVLISKMDKHSIAETAIKKDEKVDASITNFIIPNDQVF